MSVALRIDVLCEGEQVTATGPKRVQMGTRVVFKIAPPRAATKLREAGISQHSESGALYGQSYSNTDRSYFFNSYYSHPVSTGELSCLWMFEPFQRFSDLLGGR
jgi:hypothetical protein